MIPIEISTMTQLPSEIIINILHTNIRYKINYILLHTYIIAAWCSVNNKINYALHSYIACIKIMTFMSAENW